LDLNEEDCDDENHDYIIRIGEIFNYRYVCGKIKEPER